MKQTLLTGALRLGAVPLAAELTRALGGACQVVPGLTGVGGDTAVRVTRRLHRTVRGRAKRRTRDRCNTNHNRYLHQTYVEQFGMSLTQQPT